jgi:hypothetical protein
MSAGFLRRAFSSFIDFLLVMAVVTAVFLVGGRPLLQGRIEDFDVVNTAYQELSDAYNADLTAIYEQYTAAVELANDDENLIAAAEDAYYVARAVIDAQNSADIQPYDNVLTDYYLSCIYFFSIGFLILASIYTLALQSKTLGRRLMSIRLSGPVNSLSILFHDIVFKYFFIAIIFSAVSPFAGLVLLLLSLLIDLILIGFTKRKASLRDIMLKMEVVKTGYGY